MKTRLFAAALLSATVLAAQKYEVRLSPPSRVADLFLFTGSGASSQKLTMAGRVLKEEEISAEFDGRAEVLEVDAAGEPVRLAFTVARFTKSEGGATAEVLPAGSVVLVDGGAEKPVSLKGGAISDEARRAFGTVFSPHQPGAATDNDVFGSKGPRAIGESWAVNSKLAAEDAKKSGIEIAPENLKGRIELLGKDRIGEVECLSVRAELAASGIGVKGIPAGATMDEGTVQAAFSGCVPLAGSSTRKSLEMTLKARITVNGSILELAGKQKSSGVWKEIRK